MSTIDQLFERLRLAFPDENKRLLKTAVIMINMEDLIPASYNYPLPPPSTSEERLDFISFIVTKETGIEYTRNELLVAHNVLMGNNRVREELKWDLDIEKIRTYLNEYKDQEPHSAFAQTFAPPFLLPFRNVCKDCEALLKISYHTCGNILFCTRIQPCILYKADCFKCRLSYRISSIYSTDKRSIIVTSESQQVDFIHYGGGLVFSKEILLSFSSHLIDCYVTFSNFSSATIKIIKNLKPNGLNVPDPNYLARLLQTVWVYFELSNFIFMTSSSTEFIFPSAMSEGRTKVNRKQSHRATFIERNLDWIYHLFVVFWSNHDEIFGSCPTGNCSRVLILDGHQKPRRLVCKYENVTSLFNVDELGPVLKGCPYPPRRKKVVEGEPNDLGHLFCEYHREKNAEVADLTISCENQLREYLQHLKMMDQSESECNVGRNDMEEFFEKKKRSMGFIASFLNCGIIVGFSDSVNHEGPRKITDHLLTLLKLGAKLPDMLVYDAACQLHKFWKFRFAGEHMKRTIYTERLMNMTLVSDRFHNTVHKGTLCKTVFNPNHGKNKEIFKGINTSIAEQTFSYLSKFKSALRTFSYPTSALFTILIFHLKNCDKVNHNARNANVNIQDSVRSRIKQQSAFQNYCIFELLQLEKPNNDDNDDAPDDETYSINESENDSSDSSFDA